MTPFLIALQFLTRIPVRADLAMTPQMLGRSVLFYPLVGGLLGVLLWGVAALGSMASAQFAAALVLIAWVLLTGALHLDGLADSADAWVGGYGDRERTLAIMKDPYCGPAGVAAVVLILLLKYAALVTLFEAGAGGVALLVAVMLARGAMIALLGQTPYARANGIGAQHAWHLPAGEAKWVLLLMALFLALLGGAAAIVVMLVMAGLFYGLRRMMIKRLGGTTGDTCGAMVELMEAASLGLFALLY